MNLPNISKGISINASTDVTLLTIKRANIVKKSEGLIDLAKLTRSSMSSTPQRHVTSTYLHTVLKRQVHFTMILKLFGVLLYDFESASLFWR
jgi:hypothetical protein